MSGKEILDLKMRANDSGEKSIRGYLKALLFELLSEGEGFSGKRPFGNSGWEYDLYLPLIEAKVVKGKLDSNGFVEEVDSPMADAAIRSAIKAL